MLQAIMVEKMRPFARNGKSSWGPFWSDALWQDTGVGEKERLSLEKRVFVITSVLCASINGRRASDGP
jgi:hypothetical protein